MIVKPETKDIYWSPDVQTQIRIEYDRIIDFINLLITQWLSKTPGCEDYGDAIKNQMSPPNTTWQMFFTQIMLIRTTLHENMFYHAIFHNFDDMNKSLCHIYYDIRQMRFKHAEKVYELYLFTNLIAYEANKLLLSRTLTNHLWFVVNINLMDISKHISVNKYYDHIFLILETSMVLLQQIYWNIQYNLLDIPVPTDNCFNQYDPLIACHAEAFAIMLHEEEICRNRVQRRGDRIYMKSGLKKYERFIKWKSKKFPFTLQSKEDMKDGIYVKLLRKLDFILVI